MNVDADRSGEANVIISSRMWEDESNWGTKLANVIELMSTEHDYRVIKLVINNNNNDLSDRITKERPGKNCLR